MDWGVPAAGHGRLQAVAHAQQRGGNLPAVGALLAAPQRQGALEQGLPIGILTEPLVDEPGRLEHVSCGASPRDGGRSGSTNRGSTTAPLPGETGTVTWSVGDMQDGDDEIAEIVVTVLVRCKTTITNAASVSSDTDDPNADNNSASITVTVASGSGGGRGGKGGPNK